MSSSTTVSYRLRPVSPAVAAVQLTGEQREVTTNTAPRLRVLAGPGTGKTATLVEAVAERVEQRAVSPEQILVLTFSRRAAGELSGRIARRLGLTTRQSMVRTLHSYAYSIVRSQAVRSAEPPPRLLAAGEADQMVRDLLAGHIADGGELWPAFLSGALASPSFAAELREILLRAAGLGISGQRMIELGRRYRRPEWIAVGRFAREYQQVSDLRQGISGFGVALDQAELTSAALAALRKDDVLAAEQRRVRRIFVDEYQDVDAAQAKLVSVLADGADELIVFGDPDQSIYAFRGAESTALRDVAAERTVSLTVSRRLPPAVIAATRRLAARLPGTADHRPLRPGAASSTVDGRPVTGDVDVKVFPSPAREASYVADMLRRAHLRHGVPWRSMAILVRSPAAGLTALTRACAVAGVPVDVGGGGDSLSAEPLVAALLTILECGVEPGLLNGDRAAELLASPLADVDALALRRIRRSLLAAHPGEGSSADLLAAVLAGASLPSTIPNDLRMTLRRIQQLLAVARAGATHPAAEQVLWEVWRGSGLEESLVAAVERGGSIGQRADRSLDAIVGLFEMAADLAQRVPLAGVAAFVAAVRGRQLPLDQRAPSPGEAVAIMSAHAAKGLEWDVVAVAGAQEGTWPDLRTRGSLLSGQQLVDLATGGPVGSTGAGRLAEERRLFYVAATRARHTLIATGVMDQDVTPSRFLSELAGVDGDLPTEHDTFSSSGRLVDRRGLHLTDLVADLRRAVTDPDTSPDDAVAAAGYLADLAAAGVPGAHPDDWYGLGLRSTDSAAIPSGSEIRVSPSLIESLNTCALRAVLERRGGATVPGQAQIEGIVVHAMAHGLASGIAESELRAEIETYLDADDRLPPWQLDRTRRGLLSMLDAAQAWVRDHHPPRTLIGSELAVDLPIPPAGGQESQANPVRLVGRVDWLSAKPDGTVVVTDFKTGATVPTKADAQANAQLGAYQAAVALGAFDGNGPAGTDGETRTDAPGWGGTGLPQVRPTEGIGADRADSRLDDAVARIDQGRRVTPCYGRRRRYGKCSLRALSRANQLSVAERRTTGDQMITAADLAGILDLPAPTEEQVAVIEAPLEPMLVVAGAGSGKTETMAARVLFLVANGLVGTAGGPGPDLHPQGRLGPGRAGQTSAPYFVGLRIRLRCRRCQRPTRRSCCRWWRAGGIDLSFLRRPADHRIRATRGR